MVILALLVAIADALSVVVAELSELLNIDSVVALAELIAIVLLCELVVLSISLDVIVEVATLVAKVVVVVTVVVVVLVLVLVLITVISSSIKVTPTFESTKLSQKSLEEASTILIVIIAVSSLSILSSIPATVIICGTFQFAEVKVKVAAESVASPNGEIEIFITTSDAGCEVNTTAKVSVPPASSIKMFAFDT